MSEVVDIIHDITYNIQDQELQKAVTTVQKNVANIENLTKRQIKLANAYDKTLAGEESRRSRLTGLIAKNTSEINKNTKSLENTMLNNKALNRVMQQEIGIIGTVENKLKILQQARKKATSESEIKNYGNLINQQKSKLNTLNARPQSGSFGASIGKGAISQVASLIPAVGGALAIGTLASQIGDVTKKFEGYETVLRNTFQSSSKANREFDKIKEFASKTPFSVDELTGSFVKLVNRGFNPTKEELTNIGDLAASQGKSFDQLTEAILDGQSGEYERLKEFGIKAKTAGDTVTLSFKGIEKQVKKTDEGALRKAIISFGQLQGVAGGMAAASQTLDGKISNLGDSFDALFVSIGENGKGVFGDLIDGIKEAVDWMTEFIETSPVDALREEQQEVDSLINGIILLNGQTEARSMLITELNGKYPELFKNINIEKLNNEELISVLKSVNSQYERRILLAEKSYQKEKIAEQRKEAIKNLGDALSDESNQNILQGLGIFNKVSNESNLNKRIEIVRKAIKEITTEQLDKINELEGDGIFDGFSRQGIQAYLETNLVPALKEGGEVFEKLKKQEQLLDNSINELEARERKQFEDLKKILINRGVYNTKLDKLNDGVDLVEAFSKDKNVNDIQQAITFNTLYDKFGNPTTEKSKTTSGKTSKKKEKTAEEIALEKIDEAQKIEEEKLKQGYQDRLNNLQKAYKDEIITLEVFNHTKLSYEEENKIALLGIEKKYDTQRLNYQKGAEKEATKTKIKEIINSTSEIEIAIKDRSKKLLDALIKEAKILDDEFKNLIASEQEKEANSITDKYNALIEASENRSKSSFSDRDNATNDFNTAVDNNDVSGQELAKQRIDQLKKILKTESDLTEQYKKELNSKLLENDNKYFDKREEEATKRANDAVDLYTASEQARFDKLFNQTTLDDEGGTLNLSQAENDSKLMNLRELNAEIIDEEELSNRKRIKLEEDRAKRSEEIAKRSELAKLYTTKYGLENQLKEYQKQQDEILTNSDSFTEEYKKGIRDRIDALNNSLSATQKSIEETTTSLSDKTEKGLSQTTKSVFELTDSMLSAASTIASALEAMADKEIEIRERRVDKALEIADRGNAEALQIEEERLQKAQEQKEKYARLQMAINLAQQLSAATLAIAQAAASGGGFASIATITAVISALAAGYSTVSQMNGTPIGFATGVVGLDGPGTGTSDSIPARLSKGESVITAVGTKAGDNAEILKMMNNGVGFSIPKLNDNSYTRNNTEKSNTKVLESKLDGVISAVENIKGSSLSFDENGIAAVANSVEVRKRRREKL